MMQTSSTPRGNGKTEPSAFASSEDVRGTLRAGPAYRAEPGIGLEGGYGPYLTVLCCTLDQARGRAVRPRLPRVTEPEVFLRGSPEPTDGR